MNSTCKHLVFKHLVLSNLVLQLLSFVMSIQVRYFYFWFSKVHLG
ncbi:hypothetical protein O77CONTIG1_01318 [Leptolyngbya sp. O-77]|nr:hypothetical protein O77CONTIG1_01318 [Leptolyngbya sp. O-77]